MTKGYWSRWLPRRRATSGQPEHASQPQQNVSPKQNAFVSHGDFHYYEGTGPKKAVPPHADGNKIFSTHRNWLSDSYGARELSAALSKLFPEQEFSGPWPSDKLTGIRHQIDNAPASEYRIRALRILDSFEIARTTKDFLYSFMGDKVTEPGLAQALESITSSDLLSLDSIASLESAANIIEFAALNYPRSDSSCARQLARFVAHVVTDAQMNTADPRLLAWAKDIDALAAFNTEAHHCRSQAPGKRLRLIVSLHHALPGDWPRTLDAWLLVDNRIREHRNFGSPDADRQGTEKAIRDALDWAMEISRILGRELMRIEVAVPGHIMLNWNPEEVVYGQRLGVNFDVVTRWSQRLDQRPFARRLDWMVRKRLSDISAGGSSSRMHWISAQGAADLSQLKDNFEKGVYSLAVGLAERPEDSTEVLDAILTFTPIVLWPRAQSLSEKHRVTIDAHWEKLPSGFLDAYRAHWRGNAIDHHELIAEIRFAWDDEDWLNFCQDLTTSPGDEQGIEPRSD